MIPKIVYRSDSTGMLYVMLQQHRGYTIATMRFLGTNEDIVQESPLIAVRQPWRKSIDQFFDVVDKHINTGKWGIEP